VLRPKAGSRGAITSSYHRDADQFIEVAGRFSQSEFHFAAKHATDFTSIHEFVSHGRDAFPAPSFAQWRRRHHGGVQPQYR
jgi:hypothetical protein